MKVSKPEKEKLSRGQATIEYVLMLVSVVVIFSAFVTTFHTDMVHYIFSFIGQLLPEGQ
ncbi:MAG: hypothetical protein J6Y17_00490 [Elusimicrobiaceae bacterium]|nr:hypothetical protein [Elusimicrobiaceae bacterium]